MAPVADQDASPPAWAVALIQGVTDLQTEMASLKGEMATMGARMQRMEDALTKAESDKADAVAKQKSLQVKFEAVAAEKQSLINEKTQRERWDFVCMVMRERFAMMHVSCASQARTHVLTHLGF
jgi:Skp family chaperone for outer membrane proteins